MLCKIVYDISKKYSLAQGSPGEMQLRCLPSGISLGKIYRGGDKENDRRQSREIFGAELISEFLSQSFYDPIQPPLTFPIPFQK